MCSERNFSRSPNARASASMSLKEVRQKLDNVDQSQLLAFWDDLDDAQRKAFLDQLASIRLEEAFRLFAKAVESLEEDTSKLDDRMEPIPPDQFETAAGCAPDTLEAYRRVGLEEISRGHVGVVLLAGGQGTRLGVTYPKGMYSVGLPSKKTLFQIQAERIRRIQKLAESQTGRKGKVTWYIMTSGPTYEATRDYLNSHGYFGLFEEDVVLFEQGLLPCFDFNGKILLSEKNSVTMAPDGNGGIYGALARNGVLEDMDRRGVKYVHVHSVDNILVKVADPVFVGYCVTKGADCGAKVVSKDGPNEAVGVVCKVEGKFQVVEYSEISEKTANLRDEQGNLIFRAGNICNHFFTVGFLKDVAYKHESELKLHVAKKKIPYVNASGEKIIPTAPNGIKIEKFVFDVFQFTNNFVTWEVPRMEEFSGLKNTDDVKKDCPSTAKRDLMRLHKKYIEDAGGLVKGCEVEISPLLSYAGEDLKDIVDGKEFHSPYHLTKDKEQIVNGCVRC